MLQKCEAKHLRNGPVSPGIPDGNCLIGLGGAKTEPPKDTHPPRPPNRQNFFREINRGPRGAGHRNKERRTELFKSKYPNGYLDFPV